MAAFRSGAAKWSGEGVFPYWMYTDLSNEADFEAYIQTVKGLSLYDTGVDAEYGDELLTLSTCDYYTTEGRFVVVARRVDEQPDKDKDTPRDGLSRGLLYTNP